MDNNDLNSFEETINQLLYKANSSNCNTILISAENLSQQRSIKIHEILASHFDKRNILLYIRRQDKWLVSSWQQWAHKRGKTLRECIDNSLNSHQPDFLALAKMFEEIYGLDSLTVIPLHKKAFMEGNLIADFCYRTQLSISDRVERYENKSLNPYLCDILARISHIYRDHNDNSLKELLTSYIDKNEILVSNDKKILNEEQKIRILKHFENDNRILHHKYFDYLPYNEVFGNSQAIANRESQRSIEHEIDRLKDVIAIQMEIIIKLLKSAEKKEKTKLSPQGKAKKIVKNLLASIKSIIF